MTDGVSKSPNQRLMDLARNLTEMFGEQGCEVLQSRREIILVVPADRLLSVAGTLRDHEDLAFEQLIDLCGVDYAAYGVSEWGTEEVSNSGFGRGVRSGEQDVEPSDNRFAVVYHLLSIKHNRRLRMRVFAPETGAMPMVDSVIDVWRSADWYEREAFDLYGILFNDHPDLRRILTDYGFVGHPFRKDFPLIGQVEMRYDPQKGRVVYEPVSIEPRTLVPRVIRNDNRYLRDEPERQDPSDA